MAIYKPTNCDPQLMTLDLSDCASTPLFLYAKLDSTNTTVTHYSLRLLDEQNNELLNGSSAPYSLQTLQTNIGTAGYTTYLADYINANTGYNGTYLVAPLIVPYAARSTFNNVNIMYYNSGNVYNNSDTNLGISNGHSYKWELSLYQGNQTTARPSQVLYYDMILTSGVVLGSTNKRIQTVPSDEIVSDYYIQPVSIKNPSFIPVSPFDSSSPRAQTNSFLNTDYGEKGWYFTDDGVEVSNHVQSIGPRIPIKTYDSQFGHIYPYDNGSDSFLPSQFKYSATANDTTVARGYRLYKMSGNPEDLTEKQKVKAAPTGTIPWRWNHSTENPSNSYGSFTYYMNKSMYSQGDPVYPFAENMTCAYAEQVSGSTFAYGIYFLPDGRFITGSDADGVKLWSSSGSLLARNLAGSSGYCEISNCAVVRDNYITTFVIQNQRLYYLSGYISSPYTGSVTQIGPASAYFVYSGRLACCKNDQTLYAYVLGQDSIGTTSKNTSQAGVPDDLVFHPIQGVQGPNITKIGFAAENDYQRLYACGTDSDGNAAVFRATVPVVSGNITFSKIFSTTGNGALAHIPYQDENNTANYYCSMGDKLYMSLGNNASDWEAHANTSLGLPAVAGVETPVRAYFGTSQNWITIVNDREIWATQDIWGTTIPWRCLYAAESFVPFGLPFKRNLYNSTPFVCAAGQGLYRCVETISQNIFVSAQKTNVPIYSGDRILLAFQPDRPLAYDTSGNNYEPIDNAVAPFRDIVTNSQTSSKFNGIYVIDVSVKYVPLTISEIVSAQQVEDYTTQDKAKTVQITVVCRRSADADTWGEISNKVVYVQPLSVFATAPTPTPLYAGQNVQIPKSVVDSAGNNGRINKTAITFGPEEAMDLYSRGDAWSNLTAYTTGDIVKYNNHMYVALQNSTNQNPSSATSYWKQNDAVNSVGLIFYNVPKTTTNTLEYGKLYIRPYSGLRPYQWLREISTGNNPHNIIVQSVNTKYWYVTYYKIFTGDLTSNSASSDFKWYTPDETQYKILTNYRVSDETYFSFKAKPIPEMTFSSLYGHTFGIGSCNITQPAFTVTATCREYSSDGAPISKWRSYYFVVKDFGGNEIQRSRVKYDNAMSASFFGLPGAADVPASSFPQYNVELHVTTVDGVEIIHTNVITARYSNPLCPHDKYVRFEYDCCRGCVKIIICTNGQQCDIDSDHKRVFVSKREVWAGDKTGQQETITIDGQTRTVDVYDKYSEPLYHPVLIDAKLYGKSNYTEDGESFYVFNDYNVASNRQYEYVYYILTDNDYSSSAPIVNHRTGVVKTKTNRWTVTELDYDLSYDDATVYGVNPNNVWMFKYNADGGSQVLNTSKTQQDTLAQYPFFSMGPKRHMSGSISCLLGVEFLRSNMVTELPQYYYKHISANYVQWKVYGLPTGEPVEAGGYQERLRSKDPDDFVHLSSNQAIDMINQWRNLCYSGRPKLLKSPKGDIYIVQITNSQSTAQYTWSKMPDTISFDWTEIADPYDAIIIGEDDGYECNPCE